MQLPHSPLDLLLEVVFRLYCCLGSALVGTDSAEIRRLKAELRRVTEERDILKKAAAYFAKG